MMNKPNKKVIDLRELFEITEGKQVIGEGLWRDLAAGLIGYFFGKRKANKKADLLIKGTQSQIASLQKALEKVYKSNASKDEIISMLAKQTNWSDVKDRFKE